MTYSLRRSGTQLPVDASNEDARQWHESHRPGDEQRCIACWMHVTWEGASDSCPARYRGGSGRSKVDGAGL